MNTTASAQVRWWVKMGVEAPGWQGARTEHPGSIRPTRNAARRDGSAARNVELFLTGPYGVAGGGLTVTVTLTGVTKTVSSV